MSTFFKTIEEVKQFVGGTVNLSVHMDSINPVIYITGQKHLLEWLGETTYGELQTAYDEETLSAEQTKLLPYVQRALALLTFYEYGDVGSVQFSEGGGLVRAENEYVKTAYKYQVNGYKDWMLHAGYDSIEALLKFLRANQNDYASWRDDDAATKAQELLLNYASDFRRAYGKHLSRYTFECLRPLIEDLEAFAIKPTIGANLMATLKTAIRANTLNEYQKALLRLLHKALANFAIEEALKKHWVRIEGMNVFQQEKLEPQSYQKTSVPGTQPHSSAIRFHDGWGNRHLSQAKQYIEDNLVQFPDYEVHLNRELGLADDATAEDRANKIAELEQADTYEDHCYQAEEVDHRLRGDHCLPKKKNKGIVRL